MPALALSEPSILPSPSLVSAVTATSSPNSVQGTALQCQASEPPVSCGHDCKILRGSCEHDNSDCQCQANPSSTGSHVDILIPDTSISGDDGAATLDGAEAVRADNSADSRPPGMGALAGSILFTGLPLVVYRFTGSAE